MLLMSAHTPLMSTHDMFSIRNKKNVYLDIPFMYGYASGSWAIYCHSIFIESVKL